MSKIVVELQVYELSNTKKQVIPTQKHYSLKSNLPYWGKAQLKIHNNTRTPKWSDKKNM